MLIVETSIFTRQAKALLSDEEYRELQNELILRPEAGDIIRGSGGLRKIRYRIAGRGKRGGIRAIYYWIPSQEKLLMLFVYPKNVQDDLTPEQLKILKSLVEQEFK